MVRIEADVETRIQLVLQQRRRPVLREIRLINDGEERTGPLTLRATVDPAVATPLELPLAPLEPGEVRVLTGAGLPFPLLVDRLVDQTEREQGHVRLWLDGDVTSAPLVIDVEVLAWDMWPGAAAPPDVLAAFVTPNHPGIPRLLGHVREVLAARGQATELEGYQRQSRERVMELAAAVYGAMGAAGVTYATAPASFEEHGQRVRTADRVLDEGHGNCLDLTLMLCGALEQIGLNPVIVVVPGHAFPGVWLSEQRLPSTWVDEASLLRNRVGLGALCVFDASSGAAGVPFAQACAAAEASLRQDPLVFAVDVAACRSARLLPLPLRRGVEPAVVHAGRGAGQQGVTDGALPALPAEPSVLVEPFAAERSDDRLRRWSDRLLDMSLNNRLLNQRARRTRLDLLADDAGAVEDALHANPSLQLVPRPPSSASEELTELANGALSSGQLVVDATAAELFRNATESYRQARTYLDDTGTVPLYLTLGRLRWFESPDSRVERSAPILLVPVALRRDSVRGPFRIRRTDEDPLVNVALLKMLEREFGVPVQGLDELPEDELGVDVARVLQNVRYAIRDVPRFEVDGGCTIDLLSFAKFLMWSDLEQHVGALGANPVVARLLDPDAPSIPQPAPFALAEQLDEQRDAADDLCVVDADSTQLAAIWSAVDGNSFVLQGPPGTGKSQTITNLIAQLIARGRTVLFVAEKRAALDVVHRRLEDVGLGAFVLEAHSDRATRAAVVSQLGEPLSYAWQQPSEAWGRTARELTELRTTLNGHARRMNHPGPFGESLQQALGRLLELAGAARLPVAQPDEPDHEHVAATRAAVRALVVELRNVPAPGAHPLRGTRPGPWTPAAQHELESGTRDALTALDAEQAAWREAAMVLGLDPAATPGEAERTLAAALLDGEPVERALLQARQAAVRDALGRVSSARAELHAARSAVDAGWLPSLYAAPQLATWRANLERWAAAFMLLRWLMLFSTRRALRAHARRPLPVAADLVAQLTQAERAAQASRSLEVALDDVRPWYGGTATAIRPRGRDGAAAILHPDDVDVERLERLAARARTIRAACIDANAGEQATAHIQRLAEELDERLPPGGEQHGRVRRWLDAAQRRDSAEHVVLAALRPDEPGWLNGAFEDRAQRLRAVLHSASRLRDWILYRDAADGARAAGLGALVTAVEAGELAADQLEASYERSLREAWVERRFAADPELARFRGMRHQEVVDRFRALDAHVQQLGRREIQARLAARLPDPTAPGQMDVLRRELRKRRAHMPIRRLFREVRDVLNRLKPVVLMSPLTVARHLDPELPPFDVIIFDEASQIPPWDAIGSLARGRQAIVVGDSKQLPPTSFFDRGGPEDDAEEEAMADLESILDHSLASGMPEVQLGWHYRSRHETLIAFSNRTYYDNRLHIFPSPGRGGGLLGVSWEHVPDGYYDRGGSRQNRAEAEAVVDRVVSLVLAPGGARRSVGVVTFSQAQQRCVEDLLDQRRRDLPELEQALGEQPEPLFVKNLENVQGDERDVILFSIGYGPDRQGRVSMAFGPLNRDGGERRLNVAITRAREQLIVISTLRADQMDLSRTSALGVHHLKQFLEYAEHGPAALDRHPGHGGGAGPESPFEAQVAARLSSAGWQVHSQVGVAGYRIDLAVVDPDAPGDYLMAVECDGATYHSAATARDRDRLRQAVLERLGWRVLRIWSTDWWLDADGVMRDVTAALDAALEARRGARAAADATAPVADAPGAAAEAPGAATVVPGQAAGPRDGTEEAGAARSAPGVDEGGGDSPASEAGCGPPLHEVVPLLPARIDPLEAVEQGPPAWPEQATPWRGLPEVAGGPQERFYEQGALAALLAQVEQLAALAPLQVGHVARHVTRAWGFAQTSAAATERVRGAVRASRVLALRGETVWPAGADGVTRAFRYVDDDAPADRRLEDVPEAELAAALAWVVERGVSVSEDDAYREVARIFGVTRLGRVARRLVVAGGAHAVGAGLVRLEAGAFRPT